MKRNIFLTITKKILSIVVVVLLVAAPALAYDENHLELEMINLINQERQRYGKAPYLISHELMRSAEDKALDMVNNNYFAHTSPSGETPFDLMRQAGVQFSAAGENIARGTSVSSLHNALMNSSGHRANILSDTYTHVGVGIIEYNGALWVAQHFARQRNATKDYIPTPTTPERPGVPETPSIPEEPIPPERPRDEDMQRPEIPTEQPTPEDTETPRRRYVIRRGDSLWKISRRLRIPLDVLIRINNILNPDLIFEGQVIQY